MANDCLFPDWQALLYVHISAPGSHADGRDVTWGPSDVGKMKKQCGRPPRWHYKEWCLKCLARSFKSLDILGLVDFSVDCEEMLPHVDTGMPVFELEEWVCVSWEFHTVFSSLSALSPPSWTISFPGYRTTACFPVAVRSSVPMGSILTLCNQGLDFLPLGDA